MNWSWPKLTIKHLFWALYLCLLAVLVPHMAWAAGQFEPPGGEPASYAYAIVFEGMIAALTHQLIGHIEKMPRITYTHKAKMHPALKWWPVFSYRYFNAFSLGLFGFSLVSVMGNLAHAVQFGQDLTIFGKWGISPVVYAVAFGGALPLANLFFARILSDVNENEDVTNPELDAAKSENKDLRKLLKETEARQRQTEQLLADAEARFNAAGDLMRLLTVSDKRERIVIIKKQWPLLTGSAIAAMTEASPSYVSEVLKEIESV